MRPVTIDLFAGAGGLSLGFEQAGFDVVGAVEIDPVHCAVHEFNFPKAKVIAESVSNLSGQDVRHLTSIGDVDIDCVMGGAPCQGFSLIGHRVLDDPRNKLVKDFVRLVKDLKPKYFVFENVKGITSGKHRKILDELIAAFSKAGYGVVAPWKVLNAANYGTPQSRERLILLGFRQGLEQPTYPSFTTNISGRTEVASNLVKGPTCKDALDDLPNADGYQSLQSRDHVRIRQFGNPSYYAAEMRCLSNDAWHLGYVRNWDPNILTSSARTEHSKISRRRFKETTEGSVEPISRFFKLPSNGVANTLRAGTDGKRGAFTSPRPIHYQYDRCVTVREMARLHGFPDWFRFNVTKWHGARQIGNAVPPPLARAVANSIVKALDIQITVPKYAVNLGNQKLLSFDATAAANYYGVATIDNRRDKRSGAKKRKQIDIELERLNAELAHA